MCDGQPTGGANAPAANPEHSPISDDPAVLALARWRAIEQERRGIGANDAEEERWLSRSLAAERAVVAAVAETPAGLAAKLRLLIECEGSAHAAEVIAQVIAGLERIPA